MLTLHRKPVVLARLFVAVLLLFGLDAMLFRTSLYSSILEPNSTAGMLYTMLWNEKHRPRSTARQVLAIGDSRMGLRARVANESSAGTQCTFATIATPGTTPRCWYYMLRDVDPDARLYSAVILPVDDYDDEDYEDFSTRVLDLHYLVPILRLSDLAEFTFSYQDLSTRWLVLRGSLLKGLSYQRDFQDFLAHRRVRLRDLKWVRAHSAEANYNAVWDDHNVNGLSIDWREWKATYPPSFTAEEKRLVNNVLLRPAAPQTGGLAAYRRKWFGRIIDHYRQSATSLIFVRLPRGPIIRPELVQKKSSSIREFASRPGVALADERLFDELERPDLFRDAMHLNGPGGDRFSRILAWEVARILNQQHAQP